MTPRWRWARLPAGIRAPVRLADALLAYLRAAGEPRSFYAMMTYLATLYGASRQASHYALRCLRDRGCVVRVAYGWWQTTA